MKTIDMTGTRVGIVTVTERSGSEVNRAAWLCLCDCGKEVVFSGLQLRQALRVDALTSCGCMKTEICTSNGKKNKTHGFSKTKIYGVWRQMHQRCSNDSCKDYPRYGGRGISVCRAWSSIAKFAEWAKESGYGESLTIERKNVNGNYTPNNCTWVKNKYQALNRENTILYTYGGKTQSIRLFAKDYGINYYTLRGRLRNYGWSIDKALTT